MRLAAVVLEVIPRADPVSGHRLRCVLALTRIEGRRLVTHPALLAAVGVLTLTGIRGPSGLHFIFLVGMGYFVLGIGTLVAANLCASRSRRDESEELFSSLPVRTADRTAAHLLSVAYPVAATLVIAGVLAMTTRPWAGLSARLDIEPRTVMHGLVDFAQGPVAIAFLGVTGVMLARWFSPRIAVPVTFAGIVAINSISDLSKGALHWLNPAATYSSTALEPASVMTWHLTYAFGLVLLLGLAALARRPLARGLQVYGGVAVAIAAVGGTMQVLAASP